MAVTAAGRRLTEQHRQAQLAIQRGFLAEFNPLWLLLDPFRLDDTSPGWLSAVLRVVAAWRQESAQAAVDYYRRSRSVEAPDADTPPPVPVLAEPVVAGPVPERAVHRGDRGVPLRFDESRQVAPVVRWDDSDRAARTSLIVTGPVAIKRRTGAGERVDVATRQAMADAGSAGSRHVLNGGRATLLTVVEADPEALGWARVTDGDPCAFCAMLASRGPVYKSRGAASFEPHDGCGCSVEPVFDRAAQWPGRAREFQRMWRRYTRGESGKDAVRAFRRAYERAQRERDTAAA
jgi:hypothetical protein